MATKTIIDGKLLADCERYGKIRYGMLRVAEEITKRLVCEPDLDLYFSQSSKNRYQNNLLLSYLKKVRSPKQLKTISYPFASSSISILERLSAKVSQRIYSDGSFPGMDNYDIYHSFFNPFPRGVKKNKIKKCITFLDIIPLRMSGYEAEIDPVKEIVNCIVPNHAIAISEYSKNDVCDYNRDIDPNKIFVTPLAANKNLFYSNKNIDAWLAVKEKYGLPDHYFLSVSATDKRKNLEHLICSFEKFVLQERAGDLKLVLTGNGTFGPLSLQHLNLSPLTMERIVFAKPIDEEDLNVVYSNAICFFFVSLYEGFGLPVLEAMQCGVPVVTSNTTSIPEVVGDAGIMIDPTDSDLLSQKMVEIYNDSFLRQKLSVAGIERAATFSWERCAEQYASIFKTIAN